MEALKKAFKELQEDWHEYKKTNDNRLKLVETRGTAPADYDEKLDKMNTSMDDLTKTVEELQALKNQSTHDDIKAERIEIDQKGKEATSKWFRKGPNALSDEELGHISKSIEQNEEMKLLAVDVDRDGGIWVRPEFDLEIRKRIFESSPMRAHADQQTISTDSLEFPYDDDEFEDESVGETEARAETDTGEMNKVSIPIHEISAQPVATQKLLDDAAINIEAWLTNKVQMKFGRSEATQFISGNGVSVAKGILSYPSGSGLFNTVEQINSGSAGGVTSDGLIDLQNSLFEVFQGNARWFMRRATAGLVRKLKDNEDRYFWSLSGDLTTGAMQTLLGNPIHFADDMPVAAANSLSIAYGDFRAGYLIVDRIGIRVLRDPFTTKGKIKFYTTKRFGGGVQQFQAIKLQKLAA